jgi:hypothetical protein
MDTHYERETKEIEVMKDHRPLSCDVMSVDSTSISEEPATPPHSG